MCWMCFSRSANAELLNCRIRPLQIEFDFNSMPVLRPNCSNERKKVHIHFGNICVLLSSICRNFRSILLLQIWKDMSEKKTILCISVCVECLQHQWTYSVVTWEERDNCANRTIPHFVRMWEKLTGLAYIRSLPIWMFSCQSIYFKIISIRILL